MFAIRLALLVSLLYSYRIVALEGPGICPHGGHQTIGSDQGGGTDPDGATHRAAGVNGDKGLGVDPNG